MVYHLYIGCFFFLLLTVDTTVFIVDHDKDEPVFLPDTGKTWFENQKSHDGETVGNPIPIGKPFVPGKQSPYVLYDKSNGDIPINEFFAQNKLDFQTSYKKSPDNADKKLGLYDDALFGVQLAGDVSGLTNYDLPPILKGTPTPMNTRYTISSSEREDTDTVLAPPPVHLMESEIVNPEALLTTHNALNTNKQIGSNVGQPSSIAGQLRTNDLGTVLNGINDKAEATLQINPTETLSTSGQLTATGHEINQNFNQNNKFLANDPKPQVNNDFASTIPPPTGNRIVASHRYNENQNAISTPSEVGKHDNEMSANTATISPVVNSHSTETVKPSLTTFNDQSLLKPIHIYASNEREVLSGFAADSTAKKPAKPLSSGIPLIDAFDSEKEALNFGNKYGDAYAGSIAASSIQKGHNSKIAQKPTHKTHHHHQITIDTDTGEIVREDSPDDGSHEIRHRLHHLPHSVKIQHEKMEHTTVQIDPHHQVKSKEEENELDKEIEKRIDAVIEAQSLKHSEKARQNREEKTESHSLHTEENSSFGDNDELHSLHLQNTPTPPAADKTYIIKNHKPTDELASKINNPGESEETSKHGKDQPNTEEPYNPPSIYKSHNANRINAPTEEDKPLTNDAEHHDNSRTDPSSDTIPNGDHNTHSRPLNPDVGKDDSEEKHDNDEEKSRKPAIDDRVISDVHRPSYGPANRRHHTEKRLHKHHLIHLEKENLLDDASHPGEELTAEDEGAPLHFHNHVHHEQHIHLHKADNKGSERGGHRYVRMHKIADNKRKKHVLKRRKKLNDEIDSFGQEVEEPSENETDDSADKEAMELLRNYAKHRGDHYANSSSPQFEDEDNLHNEVDQDGEMTSQRSIMQNQKNDKPSETIDDEEENVDEGALNYSRLVDKLRQKSAKKTHFSSNTEDLDHIHVDETDSNKMDDTDHSSDKRNHRKRGFSFEPKIRKPKEVVEPTYMLHEDPHGDGFGSAVIDGPELGGVETFLGAGGDGVSKSKEDKMKGVESVPSTSAFINVGESAVGNLHNVIPTPLETTKRDVSKNSTEEEKVNSSSNLNSNGSVMNSSTSNETNVVNQRQTNNGTISPRVNVMINGDVDENNDVKPNSSSVQPTSTNKDDEKIFTINNHLEEMARGKSKQNMDEPINSLNKYLAVAEQLKDKNEKEKTKMNSGKTQQITKEINAEKVERNKPKEKSGFETLLNEATNNRERNVTWDDKDQKSNGIVKNTVGLKSESSYDNQQPMAHDNGSKTPIKNADKESRISLQDERDKQLVNGVLSAKEQSRNTSKQTIKAKNDSILHSNALKLLAYGIVASKENSTDLFGNVRNDFISTKKYKSDEDRYDLLHLPNKKPVFNDPKDNPLVLSNIKDHLMNIDLGGMYKLDKKLKGFDLSLNKVGEKSFNQKLKLDLDTKSIRFPIPDHQLTLPLLNPGHPDDINGITSRSEYPGAKMMPLLNPAPTIPPISRSALSEFHPQSLQIERGFDKSIISKKPKITKKKYMKQTALKVTGRESDLEMQPFFIASHLGGKQGKKLISSAALGFNYFKRPPSKLITRNLDDISLPIKFGKQKREVNSNRAAQFYKRSLLNNVNSSSIPYRAINEHISWTARPNRRLLILNRLKSRFQSARDSYRTSPRYSVQRAINRSKVAQIFDRVAPSKHSTRKVSSNGEPSYNQMQDFIKQLANNADKPKKRRRVLTLKRSVTDGHFRLHRNAH